MRQCSSRLRPLTFISSTPWHLEKGLSSHHIWHLPIGSLSFHLHSPRKHNLITGPQVVPTHRNKVSPEKMDNWPMSTEKKGTIISTKSQMNKNLGFTVILPTFFSQLISNPHHVLTQLYNFFGGNYVNQQPPNIIILSLNTVDDSEIQRSSPDMKLNPINNGFQTCHINWVFPLDF